MKIIRPITIRCLLVALAIVASSSICSYAQESSKYEQKLDSLYHDFDLMSFFHNYSDIANRIIAALPEVEKEEGKSSTQYSTWCFRLAVCKYKDSRYSEVIPILDDLIMNNLALYLEDDNYYHLYDLLISSLLRVEDYSRAESVSAEILNQTRKVKDKKYLVEVLLSRYEVRSIDPNASSNELWGLLNEGLLNTDVQHYSYTYYDILEKMLYLSLRCQMHQETNYVIQELNKLTQRTSDINTICAVQSLLYDFYIDDYFDNPLHIKEIIKKAEDEYYAYCDSLDNESKGKGILNVNEIQIDAYKLLLYLWNDYAEIIGHFDGSREAIEYSDKIIRKLTQQDNGLSSTYSERIAHFGDILEKKYLAKAYLRKGIHLTHLASHDWEIISSRPDRPTHSDSLKLSSALDSINVYFDAAFSSLEFDTKHLINRLNDINVSDREYAIKEYRKILNTALYGAYIDPEDKYVRSTFNLLMFFKNLLLYIEMGEQIQFLTIDDILLHPKEAVIEFGYSEYYKLYFAVIVSNSSHDLAIESIPESWLQQSLERGMIYRDREFCDSLMQYLEPHISGCEVVYYSPTGLFSTINLDAICRQSSYNHSFALISSSRQLCQIVEEEQYKTAALFGGLTYGTGQEIQIDSTRAGWNTLPFSLQEINSIHHSMEKGNCSTSIYSGKNGTEEVVKGFSTNSPNIIHFATHGFFMDDGVTNPYFDDRLMIKTMNRSGLIMSNGQSAWLGNPVPEGKEDGVLLAGEIAMMDLSQTDIVSLSACNTGQGVISSEGIFGLQRALKKAGVNTVIMSLWKLNDRVAMGFMDCFYKNLFDGKSKHQSFNAARDLIYANYNGDPFYWAPFIMMDGIESR